MNTLPPLLRLRARKFWPVAGLALLVACGGGGGDDGSSGFGDSGAGTGSFGGGAGTSPFGPGAGGGGGLTGDGPLPTPDAVVVLNNDAIQGSALSANSGAPLSGASIRFQSTTLTTDSDGLFSQASSSAIPRLVIQGSSTSYEPYYGVTEVLGTVPSVSLLRLTPYGTTGSITVASGGSVSQIGIAASLTVPANALVAAGGGAAPASVDLRVTSVDVGGDSNLLSGDFTDGSGALLQTYGAVTISSSVPLDVASGQQMTLQIPVSTRAGSPPSSATLYYLDSSTGRWVAGSSATLVSGAQSYYTGAVSRFAQWMVGGAVSPLQTVSGCVVDDLGAVAPNVRIAADGVTYSSIAYATTDSQGRFSLQVAASNRVVVQGRRGAYLTNATVVDVGTTAVSVGTCLTIPTTNAATMRLTWGARPADIDSHLRTPGGQHVYYASQGSLSAVPYASLDVDDVTGYGPEVTTIRQPRVGIYRFYLHNFSRTFSPGMTASPTQVELNYAGRTVLFRPPAGEGSALWWHLFDLYVLPDCSMVLYRYNRWRADEPQNPNTSSSATACVP